MADNTDDLGVFRHNYQPAPPTLAYLVYPDDVEGVEDDAEDNYGKQQENEDPQPEEQVVKTIDKGKGRAVFSPQQIQQPGMHVGQGYEQNQQIQQPVMHVGQGYEQNQQIQQPGMHVGQGYEQNQQLTQPQQHGQGQQLGQPQEHWQGHQHGPEHQLMQQQQHAQGQQLMQQQQLVQAQQLGQPQQQRYAYQNQISRGSGGESSRTGSMGGAGFNQGVGPSSTYTFDWSSNIILYLQRELKRTMGELEAQQRRNKELLAQNWKLARGLANLMQEREAEVSLQRSPWQIE